MVPQPLEVVLASGSPQRRRILELLGVSFTVRATDVEEQAAGESRAVALENARRKALAAAEAPEASGRELIVGCDTLVATGDALWGKPASEEDAAATLRALSGTTHEVVSGLAVIRAGELATAIAVTPVTFRSLSEADIARYLATGEWRGRAGGYAIQGAGSVLVARVDGDLLNVIGLPVDTLLELCPELAGE